MKSNSMDLGRWFIGFGVFLILCGILGYASNPSAAKTALISGGTFGGLSALWGIWMVKGGRLLPFMAATLTTLMLCAAFTWRAIVSWQAVTNGQPKLIAALLISSMLVASILSLSKLFASRKDLKDLG